METCAECGKPINPGEPAYAVSDPWGKTQLQKAYHSKCGDPLGIKAKDAEIARLRAAARLVWRWRNGKASDQEMVEAAKAALCPEQTGEQCCRADCRSEDSCMEARAAQALEQEAGKECPWCKTVHTGSCGRLISGGQSD